MLNVELSHRMAIHPEAIQNSKFSIIITYLFVIRYACYDYSYGNRQVRFQY